jgi:maleate cis-trans isomerase
VTVRRVGLVVPSSKVTVETAAPVLLARHDSARFSLHSAPGRRTGGRSPRAESSSTLLGSAA